MSFSHYIILSGMSVVEGNWVIAAAFDEAQKKKAAKL